MINDLELTSPNTTPWKYVYDVTMSENVNRNEISTLQSDVNAIESWTKNSNMKLNGKKCKEKIITFSPWLTLHLRPYSSMVRGSLRASVRLSEGIYIYVVRFPLGIRTFLKPRLHETGTKSNRDHFVNSVIIYNRCLHAWDLDELTQTGPTDFRPA